MELEQIANWIITRSGLLQGNEIIADSSPFRFQSDVLNTHYQGNRRLGFIYQHVCAELFHASPDYQLLAEEIQLIEDKKTLGAIDFITRNNRQHCFEQWEVAIKFFLLYDGLWYGPNSQDRLDKKLDRMLTHQLLMSKTDLFQRSYPQWHEVIPKLLMQGRLYINPFRQETIPTHSLGTPINKDRVKGYWCFESEASKIPYPIYPLEKWQWITGTNNKQKPLSQLCGQFTHGQTQDGTFWFIVPNHWPGKP